MTIYANDRKLDFKTYPNGEVIVPDLPLREGSSTVSVRWHWDGNDADLLHLGLIRGLIEQLGKASRLFIDYMPYSRMDREQDGHCFSLKYVAGLINAMGWHQVFVVEPHSQVTLDLLEVSRPIWATALLTPVAMKWMDFHSESDYLVLPDAGAYKRYSDQIAELNQCHVIVLAKRRDFATGEIQGLEVDRTITRGSTVASCVGRKALIIDDLSSRGGTFVAAADLLRQQGFTTVNLLVTHMEPAGLTGDLRHRLDRVFHTDTMSVPRPLPYNFEVLPRSLWS